MEGNEIACVGAVVQDDEGRFLLVRRGREPARGRWSIPGGKVEAGESDPEATAREVLEETGLAVEVGELVGTVTRAAPGGGTFLIRDYLATPHPEADPAGVRAGDDAVEVGWFSELELRDLPTVFGLVEALEDWGVLPRPSA